MVRLFKAIPALFLATLAAADLEILRPNSNVWWVAQSLNEIAWTCNDSPYSQFTIFVNNTDPTVLVSPMAVISVQENFQCSITISQNQANQPAGTGWTLLFASIFNSSEIYATSEEFEIKPLGSAYPTQATTDTSASASGGASTTGTADGANTTTSGALGLKAGGVFSALAGVIGLGALVL
ncbi:unnamed protein product [Cyclocybe aegerita]|uniref:Uncharacterized protein n=1 Tax=Cyclocybe aegerita TaxID=1973307 RepID=A0A8S0WR01_CYCAE|nr:unnamed protein product [Cyclocybe aegerita]